MILASWGPLGKGLGAVLGRLGGLLGRLEAVLGVLGRSFGDGWDFQFVVPLLGPSWGRLGALLGGLGALLGASGAVLGWSRGPLGPSWSVGKAKRRESQKPSNTQRKSMILASRYRPTPHQISGFNKASIYTVMS